MRAHSTSTAAIGRRHRSVPGALLMTARRSGFTSNWQHKDSQASLNAGRPAETAQAIQLPYWHFDHEPEVEDTPTLYRPLAGPMSTKSLLIEKKLYGIPFKIDDAGALDAAMKHHKCSVRPVNVERIMLPFWLVKTNVCGKFKADVKQRDPSKINRKLKAWISSPDYDFAYPLEDHFYWNQMSASYSIANSMAEQCVCGNHIPSMLIERFELLDDLQAMPVPPTLVPFEMTTETAIGVASKRTTKERVEFFVMRELVKYHGPIDKASFTFFQLMAEATHIRPVYLPMYRIGICTASNDKPVPTYVCGATGKTAGPVAHIPTKTKAWTGFGTGSVSAGITSIAFPPEIATATGLAAALIVQQIIKWYRYADVLKSLALDQTEMYTLQHMHIESNKIGFKWTPEEEEKAQYEYREELRARARKRAEFSQRVREETERDEAMRAGRAYKAERARQSPRRPGGNSDPLQYYKVLGLAGKEGIATKTEISRAFRAAAAKNHPDLFIEDIEKENAHQVMQRIIEAYNVLRDKKLRDEYDTGKLGRV